MAKAEEMSAKSNRLELNNASFQDTYAWIKFKQGEYNEAYTWILKSIENSNPPSGEVLEHCGDILLKLNRKEEALEYWRKAKSAGGTSEEIDQKIRDNE